MIKNCPICNSVYNCTCSAEEKTDYQNQLYDENEAIEEDLNTKNFSKCCRYRIIFNNATGDYVCSGCRARIEKGEYNADGKI